MQQLAPHVLKKLYPLNQLPPEGLAELMPLMRERWLHRGATLFDLGAMPDDYFYVLEGNVWLSDRSEETMQAVPVEPEAEKIPLPYILPSIHRAQATTEVRVLIVDRRKLGELVARHGTAVDKCQQPAERAAPSWQAAMLRASGFQRVPAESMRHALSLMRPVQVSRGDVIVEQGTAHGDFFVIAEGCCDVLRSFVPGARPMRIARLGVGDTFGEDSLVADAPRSATVRMATDGLLMRLEGDDFRYLIKRALNHPLGATEARALVAAGARWFDVRLPSERVEFPLPNAFALPHVIARCLPFKGNLYQRYVVACADGFDAAAVAFALCKNGYDAYWLKGGVADLARSLAKPATVTAEFCA